jgi:hypothetical protein
LLAPPPDDHADDEQTHKSANEDGALSVVANGYEFNRGSRIHGSFGKAQGP